MSIILTVKIAILKYKARRIRNKMFEMSDHLDCGVSLFPDTECINLYLKFRDIVDELAKIDPKFPNRENNHHA